MAENNRQIIGKAIFAISIVAVTAAVGVVGFAQADRSNGRVLSAAQNGYGGTAEQIRAAVDAFTDAIKAANEKLQDDLQGCISDFVPGANNNLSSAFRLSSNQAHSDFSAESVNPSAMSSDDKLAKVLDDADVKLETKVDSQSTGLVKSFGNNGHQNELQKCIKDATKEHRDAVKEAQKELKQALHDILH